MTEGFEIFPQKVTKDGTLIIIQKGLKLYNISDIVELLNTFNDENEQLKKILNQAVKQMEVEMDKNSTRYYVGLLIDCKLYKKIREILND